MFIHWRDINTRNYSNYWSTGLTTTIVAADFFKTSYDDLSNKALCFRRFQTVFYIQTTTLVKQHTHTPTFRTII